MLEQQLLQQCHIQQAANSCMEQRTERPLNQNIANGSQTSSQTFSPCIFRQRKLRGLVRIRLGYCLSNLVGREILHFCQLSIYYQKTEVSALKDNDLSRPTSILRCSVEIKVQCKISHESTEQRKRCSLYSSDQPLKSATGCSSTQLLRILITPNI